MKKNEINKSKIKLSANFLIIFLIFFTIFIFLHVFFEFNIPCPFHELTNLYCPGCGITRMFLSILKFDLYQAFRYNPFVFCLLPFFIIYGIIYYINWLHDKKTKISNKIWLVLCVLAIIFMILRNIPYFDFLAPTIIKK